MIKSKYYFLLGANSLLVLCGVFLIINTTNAATYTAKVPAAYLSSSWGTGTLDCSNSTRPEDWYEEKGRCGENAGINYWNNDLNIYKYTAKVPAAYVSASWGTGTLECSNSTKPEDWYEEKGRCGENAGINYWNNDLLTQPEAVVKGSFNTAFVSLCSGSFGTSDYELCNDKLLCSAGDEYIDNTDKCEPLTLVKSTFNTAYSQNCSNWFGTTNYEVCNDKLLCLPGDEYLDNTNLCQAAACVPTNSSCAASTYVGSSCWDGCAWIAGTKNPICTGSIPAGYTMCSGDSTGLTVDTAWLNAGTTSSSCTASRKCEYYGSSGGGGGGGTYSCTGSVPAGYTMCSGDDTGLSANMAWLGVGLTDSSCTAGRKCEYYGAGTGGATYSCTGSVLAGHTICPGDDTGLSSDMPWLKVGPTDVSCTAGRKCEYYGSSFSCTGSVPAGYTMCSGDDAGLSGSLIWLNAGTTSSSCTAARKCEYYGSSGGGGGGFSCIDPPPAGAEYCPGDDSGLSSNLSWKQVTSCTSSRKCEYTWNCTNVTTPGFIECTP